MDIKIDDKVIFETGEIRGKGVVKNIPNQDKPYWIIATKTQLMVLPVATTTLGKPNR